MDTIFALASAPGRAGLAIIRVSGPGALAAASALGAALPQARRAYLRRLSFQSEYLDEALVTRFEKGASFTGEEVVEFSVHGGLATTAALLRALGAQAGLRLAEPGEFTRRAFENGQLDLARVEGLSDLIEAETEAQRRQALRVFSGALGAKVESWRAALIRAAALVEATIDFAEEDVPVDVWPEVRALLAGLRAEWEEESAASFGAERLRAGFEVAIVGAPNVGKSTLLNALAGRDAALTSARAGTTRDVIEVRLDVAGLAVTLLDTAGLRASEDEIEQEGIARARARAEKADLRLFLTLPGEDLPPDVAFREGDLRLWAKADLGGGGEGGLPISGQTGAGLSTLLAELGTRLSQRVPAAPTMTRARHRVSVSKALNLLGLVEAELSHPNPRAEILAESLRGAIHALESLVGRVDVEDFLGEIFARFCIGK